MDHDGIAHRSGLQQSITYLHLLSSTRVLKLETYVPSPTFMKCDDCNVCIATWTLAYVAWQSMNFFPSIIRSKCFPSVLNVMLWKSSGYRDRMYVGLYVVVGQNQMRRLAVIVTQTSPINQRI
jgi:hypothetical protein